MIVSFIVVMLGFQLAQSSVEKILAPEESAFTWITVLILLVSILAKLWQGLFYRKMAKAISSTTLMAASADSMNDVAATGACAAGHPDYPVYQRKFGWLAGACRGSFYCGVRCAADYRNLSAPFGNSTLQRAGGLGLYPDFEL